MRGKVHVCPGESLRLRDTPPSAPRPVRDLNSYESKFAEDEEKGNDGVDGGKDSDDQMQEEQYSFLSYIYGARVHR